MGSAASTASSPQQAALALAEKVGNGSIPHHGSDEAAALVAAAYIRLGTLQNADKAMSNGNLPYLTYFQTSNVDALLEAAKYPFDMEAALGDRVSPAREWLLGNLEFFSSTPDAPMESEALLACKHLLGNHTFAMEQTEDGPEFLKKLHGLCRTRLEAIAEAGEHNVFLANKLGDKLGTLGQPFWDRSLRLDDEDAMGAVLDNLKPKKQGVGDGDYFLAQVYGVLAGCVDRDFQAKATALVNGFGTCRAAPVKSVQRMFNKVATDHKDELAPRAACNVDTSRNAVTFDTPKDLERGFAAITGRFPALRVKNNFRPAFDAKTKSFGYRAVLTNMLYIPDPKPDGSPVLWKDLFDTDDGRAALQRVKTESKIVGLDAAFERVWAEMGAPLATKPVRFVVESQFILAQYLAMRKQSHIWYKIFRAKDMRQMQLDFGKYGLLRSLKESELEDMSETLKKALGQTAKPSQEEGATAAEPGAQTTNESAEAPNGAAKSEAGGVSS